MSPQELEQVRAAVFERWKARKKPAE